MISENALKEICEKYEIDYEKLVETNENILYKGEYNNILWVLEFIRNELNIETKNVEKCPSILYFAPENIKRNWQFLNEQKIAISNVESCLHILPTEPVELKNTYNYILKNYGIEYINLITSILSVPVDRIQKIENQFTDLQKLSILQAAYSIFSIEEINKIIEVCRENGIEVTGNVFLKPAEEIKKIVEVCKENGIEGTRTVFNRTAEEIEKIVEICIENGIEVTGSVFLKPAEEIKKIVEVCREKGIEVTGSVFKQPAEEIKKIVEVCEENRIEVTGSVFLKPAEEIKKIVEICIENGIDITGSIFKKSSKQLEENIGYIKENYGTDYLKPLIISKNNKNLKKILPYLKEEGILETVINSASILSLTLEEIKERKEFIEAIGETMVKPNGSGFNSIFGLSKRNYAKKVEEHQKNKSTQELGQEVESQQTNVNLIDSISKVQNEEIGKITQEDKGEL